jgi:putative hydrolase of the HAD superfamily
MIKALLFDIGNVLVHIYVAKAVTQQAKLAGVSDERIQELLFEPANGLLALLEVGQLTANEFFQKMKEGCGTEFSEQDFQAAVNDMFTANQPVLGLLPIAKEKGLKLVIVSNTNDIHYPFLEKTYDFVKYFDEVVASHQIGASKPDPKFYNKALEASGCLAEECVFIDDLPENIAGARAAGFHGILYQDHDRFLQELQVLGISF